MKDLTPIKTSQVQTIVDDYKGYTIFFILHALTLITAFTWYQMIQNYIGTFKTKNILGVSVVFTLFITLLSVILHVYLSKYSRRPDDM